MLEWSGVSEWSGTRNERTEQRDSICPIGSFGGCLPLRLSGLGVRALISQQVVSEQVEMAMSGAKFEVVKFDGTGNFGLWQTRVKDLLAQQGILKALRPQKPTNMDEEDWKELQQRAAGTICLCLADKIM
ncbi:UNVERIFIED_CONTAM: hypothetical protein Sradi_6188400 [Sesamum radiatum]|uniref:Uncharacterized protein n=1 Tax=Sesamum radiatum TaxID=300843 RepID=A0AAW2KBI2_SESRA